MANRPILPKSTTARPKSHIADLPDLTTRLMASGGRDIIEAIAKRQRSNVDCHARHLPRMPGANVIRYGIVRGLSDIGLITIRNSNKASVDSGVESYRLTAAGWAVAGNMPWWLEDAA